ncbi:hypothetical protein GUITHDRAFT_56893, partial [Guillardia theta CCMP2712]
LKKVMSSGTLNDKMASMMLMIQQSPVHRLQVLDILLKMASKRGKREHSMALETLKDLFETDLLPDRKLTYFHEQPVDEQAARNPTLLVMWYFEDAVKHKFAEFITHLEAATHDSLTHVRTKVCRMSYDLLRTKAEQEQANLFLLVNKLGDPDKKVSSHVMYLLNKLLLEHPAMKAVVAAEVQRLLFRPNVSDRAKHYATAFLNQIILAKQDGELAKGLVGSYLGLFRKHMEEKKNFEDKTLTAILTGVNRALPFLPLPVAAAVIGEHLDSIFKMVYVATFNTSIQALQVLFQATADAHGIPSARYYRALY